MRILKRLFDRAPQETPASVDVPLASLQGFIDQHLAEQIDRARVSSRAFRNKLSSGVAEVQKAIDALESAKSETGDRIDAPVNMLKAAFIKKARATLAVDLNMLERVHYETVENLHTTAAHAVSQLKQVQPKQAVVLSNYFKQNSVEIAEKIRALEEQLAALDRFLRSEGQALRQYDLLTVGAQKQAALIEELGKQQSAHRRLSEEITKNEQKREQNQQRLQALLEGSEWRAYTRQKETMRENEEKRKLLLSELRVVLATGERAFKKFAYQENDARAEEFLQDPVAVMMAGRDREVSSLIDRMLTSMGELSEKEQEKLRQLKEYLRASIPEKRDQYQRLVAETQDLIRHIQQAEIEAQKQDLESAIERLEHERAELEESKRRLAEYQEQSKRSLEKNKNDIERLLFETTKKQVSLHYQLPTES